jgi:hypothetical protein
MANGHKTHIIKIQNLSSGDVLVFRDSYIQNYSFKRIVNWDTTNVIGRMDPIKTYKNTEAKIDINFTVVNPHRNIIFYPIQTDIMDEITMKNFFNNLSTPFKTTGIYGYAENLGTIGKMLYPSYDAGADNYSMKSAPVLRVVIYKDRKEQNKIFDGYATVNAIDVNLKAEDVSSPGGRNFSNTEFSILFDVLHTNEGQVASRLEFPAEKIVGEILGTSPSQETTPEEEAEGMSLIDGMSLANGMSLVED